MKYFVTLKEIELELPDGKTVKVSKGKCIKLENFDAQRLLKAGVIEPYMNPDRILCKRCGKVAERFCYDINRTSKSPYCNWFCLECEPYHFN